MIAVAPSAFVSCNTPSSEIDGGDLLGLYSRDAGADASDGGKKASKKDAGAPPPMPDASVREPESGVCVAAQGAPDTDISRIVGRPACRDAQVLEWRDPGGSPRYACVFTPKGGDARGPLPLVIFFHDPEDDPTSVDKKTGLRKHLSTFALSGDAARPGFVVLAPEGRHIHHGKLGSMFDADYTGPDNVDVATVDHFVAELDDRKLVDRRRIYAIGASYGGHMAATYAMMRADRVAAFGVIDMDEPRAVWSCGGPPPPAMVLYRACDAVVSCESVERWLRTREAAGAETPALRLGAAGEDEPSCSTRNKCTDLKGTANHHRWPKTREVDLLRFLSAHAIRADESDGGI